MKLSEIRLIQKNLSDTGFYTGTIDGKRGAKTNQAIENALAQRITSLPDDWQNWSDKRQAIAYLQLLCHENNIDAGKIDGFNGPTTESAVKQLAALLTTGSIPRGFGDINPTRINPHNFPLENINSLKQFYGNPCEIPLVKVPCPWKLRLDWDLKTTTNVITIHKNLSDSLAGILQNAYDIYGINGIKQFGLDRYGGSMNCRKKRGSVSAWSTHAWGIAIDWFPSRNKLHWDSQRASLAHPDLDAWWALWEQEGWLSLGRTENRDWMHIQAAKRD